MAMARQAADCGNIHNLLRAQYSFKLQGMNMMNHWNLRSTSRIAALLFLTITSGISSAHSQIWSGNSGVGLRAGAAKFSINGGASSITSTTTIINYYTDSNCSNDAQIISTKDQSYTFLNPSQVVAPQYRGLNVGPDTGN